MAPDKILHQRRNVLTSLAQRGQLDHDNVQPMPKVFAKLPARYECGQVAMRCRDHANIDRNGLAAADAGDHSFLQHAQQFCLCLQREIADLVEEECAVVGLLKTSDAPLIRTGKCAAFMPE